MEHGRNTKDLPLNPVNRFNMELDWLTHYRKLKPESALVVDTEIASIRERLASIEAANDSKAVIEA